MLISFNFTGSTARPFDRAALQYLPKDAAQHLYVLSPSPAGCLVLFCAVCVCAHGCGSSWRAEPFGGWLITKSATGSLLRYFDSEASKKAASEVTGLSCTVSPTSNLPLFLHSLRPKKTPQRGGRERHVRPAGGSSPSRPCYCANWRAFGMSDRIFCAVDFITALFGSRLRNVYKGGRATHFVG
jgi:hypothetical protein